MRRTVPPIHAFRRRLFQLIDEQYEGRYTALARRAGIPISTMQHYVHAAKRLPGGEHMLRLAAALGVTVQYLITGQEGVRPAAEPPAAPTRATRDETPPRGPATHLSVPVFRCGCPGSCPLAELVPAVAAAHARAVVPIAMLAHYEDHRYMAVEVSPELPGAAWPVGTQLVLDWDARDPRWEAPVLLHDAGRCRLGHVAPIGGRLLFAPQRGTAPEVVSPAARIVATVVAAVTPL